MQWTKGQESALQMAAELRTQDAGAVGTLIGYAGTGKTTVIKEIAAQGKTMLLAPTGKAALRIEEATGFSASTIHRWLYRPFEDDEGDVHFSRYPAKSDYFAETAGDLIVIDEASMVGDRLWEDLITVARENRNRILVVGDDYQLPPIESSWNALQFDSGAFSTRLNEIVRQALDSPIVAAATGIREGVPIPQALLRLPVFRGRDVQHEAVKCARANAPILVYTNTMRRNLNTWLRKRLGLPTQLVEGEPLLVLLNNYECGVFNGEIVSFGSWIEPLGSFSAQVKLKHKTVTVPLGLAEVKIGGDSKEVALAFTREAIPSAWLREAAQEAAYEAFLREITFLHCDLGYVLTCHKAQGSEWPHVLVMLEPQVYQTASGGRRWIYTALTRGKTSVQVGAPPWQFDQERRLPAITL